MSGRRLALSICLLACAAASVRADEPAELRPTDFAFGRSVSPSDAVSPLVEVALPVDVYRASRVEGLADVWVFNARGAPVPHALRRGTQSTNAPASAELVPIYPVRAATPLELSLVILRGPNGEIQQLQRRPAVDVAGAPAAPGPQGEQVASYLLDVRGLKRDVRALRFSWLEPPAHLILPLSIEASADLISWRPLSVEGGLLRLEHAGNRIERDRVELASGASQFLRVSPADQSTFPAQLRAVFAEPAADVPQRVLERLTVEPDQPAANSGVYRFDLGGELPVERIEIELPEDNTVIAAEIWAADKRDGPYQRIAEARFYRVHPAGDPKPLIGPSVRVLRQRARFYELRVDATRLGLGASKPALIAHYAPDELLFLRRGEGPFTLAYGRHAVARKRFEAQDLLTLVPHAEGKPASATLSEPKPLGEASVLEPPKPPPPYTTYALWAVLIAGVALLGTLAYRLIKS